MQASALQNIASTRDHAATTASITLWTFQTISASWVMTNSSFSFDKILSRSTRYYLSKPDITSVNSISGILSLIGTPAKNVHVISCSSVRAIPCIKIMQSNWVEFAIIAKTKKGHRVHSVIIKFSSISYQWTISALLQSDLAITRIMWKNNFTKKAAL